ncbi:MAG: hypothetical protein AAGF45_00010 [Pseudomonadota bacterium]
MPPRFVAPALAFAAVLFSLALACAMPFAGLAATAALVLGLRGAIAASLLGWAMNQIVGYGLLGYPVTVDSIGWGIALGASAAAATLAAHGATRAVRNALRPPVALLAAFAAQQFTVFAARLVLPSNPEAFAPSVVASLFAINALAFGALFALCLALPNLRRPLLGTAS